jgi:hypothetical protein
MHVEREPISSTHKYNKIEKRKTQKYEMNHKQDYKEVK